MKRTGKNEKGVLFATFVRIVRLKSVKNDKENRLHIFGIKSTPGSDMRGKNRKSLLVTTVYI